MKKYPVIGLTGQVISPSVLSTVTGLTARPVASSLGHSSQPNSYNSSYNSPVSGSIPHSSPVAGSRFSVVVG